MVAEFTKIWGFAFLWQWSRRYWRLLSPSLCWKLYPLEGQIPFCFFCGDDTERKHSPASRRKLKLIMSTYNIYYQRGVRSSWCLWKTVYNVNGHNCTGELKSSSSLWICRWVIVWGRELTAEKGELCSELVPAFPSNYRQETCPQHIYRGLVHSLSSGYFLFLAVRAEKSNISWNCSQKLNIQKAARTCCGYPTHFWRHPLPESLDDFS